MDATTPTTNTTATPATAATAATDATDADGVSLLDLLVLGCRTRNAEAKKGSADVVNGADSDPATEVIKKQLLQPYPFDEEKLKALSPEARYTKLYAAARIYWRSVTSKKLEHYEPLPAPLTLAYARQLMLILECTAEERDFLLAMNECDSAEMIREFKCPAAFEAAFKRRYH